MSTLNLCSWYIPDIHVIFVRNSTYIHDDTSTILVIYAPRTVPVQGRRFRNM